MQLDLHAVSIIMHDNASDGRNMKRLRFMADLSGKDSEKPDEDARANRMRKIDQVSSLMRQESCYRRELVDYFCSHGRQRRSLSIRILEWSFSSRSRVSRSTHYCDFCDREANMAPVAYTAAVLRGGG